MQIAPNENESIRNGPVESAPRCEPAFVLLMVKSFQTVTNTNLRPAPDGNKVSKLREGHLTDTRHFLQSTSPNLFCGNSGYVQMLGEARKLGTDFWIVVHLRC